MKILAVETSTNYLCLALSDGRREYTLRLESGRKLSSMLVPVIERAVRAAGWDFGGIDHFGCGIGPGSFTAVRIGMAAVKALAWSARRPVAGVSSLQLLAQNLSAHPCPPDRVIAVIDAKRSMVYTQAFASNPGGLARPLGSPLLATAAGFSEKIQKKYCTPSKKCILVGDGIPVLQHLGVSVPSGMCADKDHWYPQPQQLLACVRAQIAAGAAVDAKTIEPLYLYPPECQVRTA